MKNLKYIVAIIFIYFGAVQLMASVSIMTLIELMSSSVSMMFILPQFLSSITGSLEIFIGVSLLHSAWSKYSIKLLSVYVPMVIAFLLLQQNVIFSDSPFILSWSINSIISHTCLLLMVYIVMRQELKQRALSL